MDGLVTRILNCHTPHTTRHTTRFATVVAWGIVLLGLATPAAAQEPLDPAVDVGRGTIDEPEIYKPAVEVYAGFDVATKYISRGIVYADAASFQPYVELYFPLAAGDEEGLIRETSLFIGNWNSFQEGGPGVGQPRDEGTLDNWYEADLYGGVAFSLPAEFNTSFGYYYFTSPSDSFVDIHELEWKLRYDDTGFWERRYGTRRFTLSPALRVTKEISEEGRDNAFYVQPSITPRWALSDDPDGPALEVPVILGFGDNGQYRDAEGDDIFFGYVQTGLGITWPLNVLPDGGGSLALDAGVDVIFVTDEAINGLGNTTEVVGKIGLNWAL